MPQLLGYGSKIISGYDVYITPQFHHAEVIAQAGADIIAIDATTRNRPENETVTSLITQIHKLGKPVMADIDTIDNAIAALKAGCRHHRNYFVRLYQSNQGFNTSRLRIIESNSQTKYPRNL